MPPENETKFTEDEHLAVLADRVAKETADITAERDQLKVEKDELANKLDVETAAKVAAEQARDAAVAEFEAFKTGLDELREVAGRKDERLAKVKEAAPALSDEFLADEERIARIVAMDDVAFEGYVADIKSVSPTDVPVVPRETAMGGSPAGGAKTESAGRAFLLNRTSPIKEG